MMDRFLISITLTHRSPPFRIFILVLLSALFFSPGDLQGNANTVSRMGTIFSLVQEGSFRIDRFAPYTTDRAEVAGHSYSDKAPGQPLVALVPAAATIAIWTFLGFPEEPIIGNNYTPTYMAALWVSIAFTSSLFTSLAAVWVYILARHLGASAYGAAYASLGYGLCTPALGWAGVLFSHGMVAGCVFISFALVAVKWDAGLAARNSLKTGAYSGVLMGLAVVTEFTAVLPAAIMAVLLGSSPRHRDMFLGYVCGALPFGALLAIYNAHVFGSVTALSYGSVVGFDAMRNGSYGIGRPRIGIIFELIMGKKRGIIWISPWLILTPIAFWSAMRIWGYRVALTALCVVMAYLFLNAGYHYWDGGWSTGPRHMVAALPFLCLLFAALWDESSPTMRIGMLTLIGISAALSIVCASVGMAAPGHFSFPLKEYLIPNFVAGRVHNFLTLMGVSGAVSMIFIPPLIVIAVIWLRTAAWGVPIGAQERTK